MNRQNLNELSSIFTNFQSLLDPDQDQPAWPVSLELPNPFDYYEKMLQETISTESSEITAENKQKQSASGVTACPHKDRKHYAKSMCNKCYHRFGRRKLAWACPHTDRILYAKGRCQFCYLKYYHRLRVARGL